MCIATQPTQVGGDLPQRGAHIVDDGRPGRDRGPGNLGATGVDGDAGAKAVEGGDRLDHGDHTGQLLVDRHRGSARSGRLAPHVDEGRSLVHKAARLGHRGVEIDIAAAVAERVGRDVQDAHDLGDHRRQW